MALAKSTWIKIAAAGVSLAALGGGVALLYQVSLQTVSDEWERVTEVVPNTVGFTVKKNPDMDDRTNCFVSSDLAFANPHSLKKPRMYSPEINNCNKVLAQGSDYNPQQLRRLKVEYTR